MNDEPSDDKTRKRPKFSAEKPFQRPERGPGQPEGRGSREARPVEPEPGERIAKRLARAGIASRRDAEGLIEAGRVRVNGKVLASPALNVTRDDVIEVDGSPLPAIERTRLFLFHKPAGVVTTNRDPQGRKTVFDVLPGDLPRLITVGRLDINTEGLLLLTNDGGLARVLELPETGWLRRYRVRVHGKVDEQRLAGLKDGIAVEGVFYGAIEAALDREQGSNAWLTIGLREGKNREVKNVLGALGLEVNRLIRISFGPFQLGELPEGHVQELKGRTLRDQLGDRLIEEAGADFESDIVKPFSNRPMARERDERPALVPAPERLPLRVGEGGLVKRRHAKDPREDALKRLQTSRPASPRSKPDGEKRFGEKRPMETRAAGERPGGDRPGGDKPFRPRGGKEPRESKPLEPPGGRKSNVWMAPGARPPGSAASQGKPAGGPRRADATESFRKPARRDDRGAAGNERPPREGRTERPERPYRAKPAEGASAGRFGRREDGEKPARPFTPRGDRPSPGDKPSFGKKPPFGAKRSYADKPGGGGGRPSFGDRKPFEKRPPRDADAASASRPARARPEGAERPRRFAKPDDGSKPRGDFKPRGEFKPRGDRPAPSGKPAFKGKPKSGPPRDRPAGGDKPRQRGKPDADRRR